MLIKKLPFFNPSLKATTLRKGLFQKPFKDSHTVSIPYLLAVYFIEMT